jgi:hypothetical protein
MKILFAIFVWILYYYTQHPHKPGKSAGPFGGTSVGLSGFGPGRNKRRIHKITINGHRTQRRTGRRTVYHRVNTT